MSYSIDKLQAIGKTDLGPTVRAFMVGGNASPAKPTDAVAAASQLTDSKQIKEDWINAYEESRAIRPPHSIESCLAALVASTRLQKIVRTFARNTVGLGWDIMRKPSSVLSNQAEETPEVAAEDERLSAFFDTCNPMMPFSEVMERIVIDRETTGDGYMEVTRDADGNIANLYHLPAVMTRLRGDSPGFIQIQRWHSAERRRVYFKMFGDSRPMNRWTGNYAKEGEVISIYDQASEVIRFTIYSPSSFFYGQPRWLSALAAIYVSQQAKEWNLNFVANNASWPIAIITENAELDAETQNMLADVVGAQGKGIQGAGRVLFLQAAKKHPAYRGTDTRIKIEKLAMGQQDDGSFLKLMKSCDDEIRETYGMAELFLGSAADLNRASAAVSRQVTNEQEFVPQQKRDEYIINATIMRELGAKLTTFRFSRPRTTDNLQDSQILSRLKAERVMTGQEIRRAINRLVPESALPHADDTWAAVPPVVQQQGASARTAAITASTNPDSKALDVLQETALEEVVQRAVRHALDELGAEE